MIFVELGDNIRQTIQECQTEHHRHCMCCKTLDLRGYPKRWATLQRLHMHPLTAQQARAVHCHACLNDMRLTAAMLTLQGACHYRQFTGVSSSCFTASQCSRNTCEASFKAVAQALIEVQS